MLDLPMWHDGLCLDRGPLDLEHRELLALTAAITAHAKAGNTAEVTALLPRLHEDCRQHFAHEEAFMGDIAYPHREEHHREHQRLLRHFESLLAPGLAGETRDIVVIMECVRSLVIMHILNDDLEIRDYLPT